MLLEIVTGTLLRDCVRQRLSHERYNVAVRVGQRRHVLGVTGALKVEAYRPRGAHLDWPMQAGLFAFRSHERSVQEWFERTADQRVPSLAVVEVKQQERGSFGSVNGSVDLSIL